MNIIKSTIKKDSTKNLNKLTCALLVSLAITACSSVPEQTQAFIKTLVVKKVLTNLRNSCCGQFPMMSEFHIVSWNQIFLVFMKNSLSKYVQSAAGHANTVERAWYELMVDRKLALEILMPSLRCSILLWQKLTYR